MEVLDMKKLRKIAGLPESTHEVTPAEPKVEKDVAQEIAQALFHAAESQVANVAADESGHGFSGNAIAAEAEKILQRAKMFLDDLIKQGK